MDYAQSGPGTLGERDHEAHSVLPTMVEGYYPPWYTLLPTHPGYTIPSTVYHDQGVRCAPLLVDEALGSDWEKALGRGLFLFLKS